jgi:tetratricopeptide (TPR) repeat protein
MGDGLGAFLDSAPTGADQVLQILALAESLTDAVATRLYELSPLENLPADAFVDALHYANFVQPRNSEWHLQPEVRETLLARRSVADDLLIAAHTQLLDIARHGDRAKARTTLPGYLFTDAGQAYHLAALGCIDEALPLYSRAAQSPLSGAQWLAGKLATEQVTAGVISADRVEILFLRAMILFREGKKREAKPFFEKIVCSDAVRIEVAIAAHLLANMIHNEPERAEGLYRKSIAIREELGDVHGIAKTRHSLGRFLWRRHGREAEAEELYRLSLAVLVELEDPHGVGQTSHSLANLLARKQDHSAETEELYCKSISLGEQLGDRRGLGQRLHSLANFLSRDAGKGVEAESLYRQSLAIDEDLGNQHGVAQTLHGLANLLARDAGRLNEAEKLLRKSIAIGEQRGNWSHLAQTLLSLALMVEKRSPDEAERLLERSLELDRREGNQWGERLVLRTLAEVRARRKGPPAD